MLSASRAVQTKLHVRRNDIKWICLLLLVVLVRKLPFLLRLGEYTTVLAVRSYTIMEVVKGFYKGNAAESKITTYLQIMHCAYITVCHLNQESNCWVCI